MLNRELTYKNETYKQIQKRTAKKLFKDKKTVYVIQCNANPNSPWIHGFYALGYDELVKHDDFVEKYDFDFDARVNNFEYYNCKNNS